MEINRFPPTNNKSLTAHNAADELMCAQIEGLPESKMYIANDRFGYLTLSQSMHKLYVVLDLQSQQKAIAMNAEANNTLIESVEFLSPLDISIPNGHIDVALINIPKSAAHFELYLQQLSKIQLPSIQVYCGFMTKRFSPSYLKTAEKYYQKVTQSKAKKKARLIILSDPKPQPDFINTVSIENPFDNKSLTQYFGVFSSSQIDYATQFLLTHIDFNTLGTQVTDMASGSGVIARCINKRNPATHINLVDDSILAIESGKLNLQGDNIHHYWNYDLSDIADHSQDTVITNPPFHIGFENTIEIALALFMEAKRVLKEKGNFIVVANRHLNYQTHLDRIFGNCRTIAENKKFIIYSSTKQQ